MPILTAFAKVIPIRRFSILGSSILVNLHQELLGRCRNPRRDRERQDIEADRSSPRIEKAICDGDVRQTRPGELPKPQRGGYRLDFDYPVVNLHRAKLSSVPCPPGHSHKGGRKAVFVVHIPGETRPELPSEEVADS